MKQPSSNRLPLAHHIPVNTHHSLLSTGTSPTQQGLLEFLQSGWSDPVAGLFSESGDSSSFLLNNVQLEPVAEEPVASGPVMVGKESRLSESMLWQIQENFYKSEGINAWATNVPFFISSSAYIADCYSEMMIAFIDDYYEHLNMDAPIYIIEMATGSGRFSHLTVKELDKKLSYFEKYKNLSVKYVMTDFTDDNPTFWQTHDKFKPYVEKGLLDFAVFNPLVDQSITLKVSGQTVSADTVKNPIIAIANYFFDTIPQDLFRVESKRLMEGLVSLERDMEKVQDAAVFPVLEEVTPVLRYRELRNEHYYPDSRLNDVLNFYKHNIKQGAVIFPVGAFQVLSNLRAMSSNRVVLLSSDKAFNSYQQMICCSQHDYALHGGAFSYMVNYDAIGRDFQNRGGQWLTTQNSGHSLQTVCCVETDQPDCRFERLNYVFDQSIQRLNPINTVCTLLPENGQRTPVAEIDYWLSYIRLNLSDPKIFALVTQNILNQIPHIQAVQQQELLRLMDAGWENYYHFPGEVNLPFWYSQLYFSLGMYQESADCIDMAIKNFGAHEALYFLKGQSFEKLNQWADAKAMYEKAMEINPGFTEAWDAIMSLETRFK